MQPSMKNLLQGGPIDFQVEYVGPLQEFPKKDGGTYEAHEVKLMTRSNSEVYSARWFAYDVLNFKVGDLVRGELNAKGWPAWSPIESGETVNNYQQVKAERAVADVVHKEDVKSIAISLQGLAQAYVNANSDMYRIQGEETTVNMGLLAEDAVIFAKIAREKILEAAQSES